MSLSLRHQLGLHAGFLNLDFESSLALIMMEKYPLKEALSVFTSGWSSVAFLGPVRRKNSMNLNARHYLWRGTSYWRFEDMDPENAAGYEVKTQSTQRNWASNLIQEQFTITLLPYILTYQPGSVLVSSACYIYNNRHLFLLVLETGKSKTKELSVSVSCEGSLPGSQMAASSLRPHMAGQVYASSLVSV